MSTIKLTIVPVKLDSLPTETSLCNTFPSTAALTCVIKTSLVEIYERSKDLYYLRED